MSTTIDNYYQLSILRGRIATDFINGKSPKLSTMIAFALAFHFLIIAPMLLPSISSSTIKVDISAKTIAVNLIYSEPNKEKVIVAKAPNLKSQQKVTKAPAVKKIKQKEPPSIVSSSNNQTSSKTSLDNLPVVSEKNLDGTRVAPQYPKRSLFLKQEGVVILHALVNKLGAIESIKMVLASKFPLLNNSAMKAVKQWKFASTGTISSNSRTWVEIPVEFKIQ